MNDRQKKHAYQISRRTMLRGAGVAMALPWLESIPVWGADAAPTTLPTTLPAGEAAATAGMTAAGMPKRVAVLFQGCGINPNEWWAQGAGEKMTFGKILEPMEKLKTKMNYIGGLFNQAAMNVGIHPGQTGNLLSGSHLQKGAELHGGVSMDQMIASKIGDQTVQPSLVLGCEQPVTGYHETNFSMAYSSHISWQSATSPVDLEEYPSLAFDSLFDNHGNQSNKSILDRVRQQAADLSRKVSASDKAKLDEYLSSVREVEQRVESARNTRTTAKENADSKGQEMIGMKRPDNGLPEDVRDHMRLMCDIVALGFQTDKTRIASLLLCRDISGICYPFLNVSDSHHPASHHDTTDNYTKICQYYISQYAYLVSKLDSMKEGDGTVLDNSCIMFMSSMWSGSKHDSSQVPLLTSGSLGGTLKTGRVLDYYNDGDQNRKLCSFYMSIMDRMGVKLDKFGDADKQLKAI
jgi:hypothetical protein